MSQSTRYEIATALAAAVEAAAADLPAKYKRNPTDPANLVRDGSRHLWFTDESDGFIDDKGQQGLRRYTCTLGVIGPDHATADADQFAAEAAMRKAALELAAGNATSSRPNGDGRTVGDLRELQTVFKVEGVDAGGALIVTTFGIDYRRPKPART